MRSEGKAIRLAAATVMVGGALTFAAIAEAGPSTVDVDGDSYSPATGDCNDADALIHPGASDIPEDGTDQDCNSQDATYVHAVIDTGPSGKTTKRSPAFTFHGEGGTYTTAGFKCSVDGGNFETCTSGDKLPRLSRGKHKFQVQAVDDHGFVETSSDTRRFKVVKKR